MRVLSAGLLCLISGLASPEPYADLLSQARGALELEDYEAATRALDAAQQRRPYSLLLARNRIATRAMAGDVDGALQLAHSIAARGLYTDLSGEAFVRLRQHPGYPALAARLAANDAPRGQPVLEREFPDSGLLPEALARLENQWLVGSVRTGAVLRAGPSLAPVASLPGGVYDIEVRGSALLAAVNRRPPFEHSTMDDPVASVVEIEWPAGSIRRSFSLDGDALIGDLEVARDGRIFVTDSITPRLAVLEPGRNAFRVLSQDSRFVNLQGLALDEGHDQLFVADYLAGLFVVDATTGATREMANPSDAHLGGIDGLYLYRGDLVGIQNGVVPQRIVRIRLDAEGTTAIRVDVLQQKLPGWNEPTHGMVAGSRLYYLATSNWPAYEDDGSLREDASLAPLRIMSVVLD